jgi:L-alanine-DL-glutamate epimerase-like enolase superfamily enzyme
VVESKIAGDQQMRVLSAEISVINLPFRFAFKHSLASRSYSENIIVKVAIEHQGQTFIGYGEGIPRDYVTGEAITSSVAALQNEFFPLFRGQQFTDVSELFTLLETNFRKLQLHERPLGAAWCALELAIIDGAAQALGQKVTALLGGFEHHQTAIGIRYGGVVPFSSKKILPAILWFYKFFGFKTIKLKVGQNLKSDLEMLALARKILGRDSILRIDANCAWTVDEAIGNLKAMRTFDIASVEQPLAADDLSGLAYLTKNVPEQIVADESLCTIAQAQHLAENKTVSGFNVRISKVGGLLASREIVKIADAHGIAVHLGAQVGESAILSAAARAFAGSQHPFDNYEGSNNLFLLKKDISQENLNVGKDGFGKFLKGAGLGVHVLPDKLKQVTQSQSTVEALSSEATATMPMVKR